MNNAEQVAGIAREEEQCLLKLDALERARLTLMQQLGGDQTGAGFVEQLEPEGGGLPELLETLAANLRQLRGGKRAQPAAPAGVPAVCAVFPKRTERRRCGDLRPDWFITERKVYIRPEGVGDADNL